MATNPVGDFVFLSTLIAESYMRIRSIVSIFTPYGALLLKDVVSSTLPIRKTIVRSLHQVAKHVSSDFVVWILLDRVLCEVSCRSFFLPQVESLCPLEARAEGILS